MELVKKISEIESELKYNKSRLFKRAHYLNRTTYMSFSEALTQVWKEAKDYRVELIEELEALYNMLSIAITPQITAQYDYELNTLPSMQAAYNNGNNLNA